MGKFNSATRVAIALIAAVCVATAVQAKSPKTKSAKSKSAPSTAMKNALLTATLNNIDRTDIVAVFYYAKKNPEAAAERVKDVMHTRDPNGVMNPYWIVEYLDTVVDKKTGCGMIIGRWYTNNYLYSVEWDNVMHRGLPSVVDNAIWGYMNKDSGYKWTRIRDESVNGTIQKKCNIWNN